MSQADIAGRAARARLWFIAANGVFLATALASQTWSLPLQLAALLAGLLAIPGVQALRGARRGSDAGHWLSRGTSWLAATLALSALHVALPYVAFGEGSSLWGETAYGAVGILIAGGGFLAWNAVLLQGELPAVSGRLLVAATIAHGALLAAAFWLAATGMDAVVEPMHYAGEVVERVRHQQAPLLASAPAALWLAAWVQAWSSDRRPE